MSVSVLFFVIFCFFFAVQLYYYLFVFAKFSFYKPPAKPSLSEPVSVIICAKNEAENLQQNLPKFFAQQYPAFEIVVVNDCSVDESEEVLKIFSAKHSNLHVVNLKEEIIHEHDKKLALTLGIKGAKNELLLFTDADCEPKSDQWIMTMSRHFTGKTEIILGYGAYKKEKSFLNKMIRFDTLFIALQYLSFAIVKNTYMGVGRNLAYRKSLFFANRGFANHYHIKSGDDDLFINQVATPGNTVIEVEENSHTLSEPKKTFSGWFAQKKRHVTTSVHYKLNHKLQLFTLSLSVSAFWVFLIVLLALKFNYIVLLSIFVFRLIIQLVIFSKAMNKLGEKDLLFLVPLLEFLTLFIYPAVAVSNLFTKKHKWK
jgi:glycosyltransferase involved in cell wall biosynthesis